MAKKPTRKSSKKPAARAKKSGTRKKPAPKKSTKKTSKKAGSKKKTAKRATTKKTTKKTAKKKSPVKKAPARKTSKKAAAKKTAKKTTKKSVSKKTSKQSSVKKKTAAAGSKKASTKKTRVKDTTKGAAAKKAPQKKSGVKKNSGSPATNTRSNQDSKKPDPKKPDPKKTDPQKPDSKKPESKKQGSGRSGSSRKKSGPSSPPPPDRPLLLGPNSPHKGGPLIPSSKRTEKSDAGERKSKRTKTPFTQKQLEEYRRILLAKRSELVGDVQHLEDEALRSSSGETRTISNAAEFGTDSFDQSMNLDLAAADRRLIEEIDAALERIQNRTYGLCELTHEPIAKDRLAELPWAKYSIEAARTMNEPHHHR